MGGRERTRGCLNLKECASDRHVVLLIEAPLGADILGMAVAGATNLSARGAPPPRAFRSAAALRAAALRRLAQAAGAHAPCFAVTSFTATSVTLAALGPDGFECATTERDGSRAGATVNSVLTAP